VLAAGVAGCAWFGSADAPAQVEHGRLVDAAGFSLYTFDRDEAWSTASRCTGECAARFPPLRAGAAAKRIRDFRVLTRPDGTRQWTFKGLPLYRFAGDGRPGDTVGDGDGNLWRLARP